MVEIMNDTKPDTLQVAQDTYQLKLTRLQEKLCYIFKDIELLQTALTHSSYSNEHKSSGGVSNERLEFLGDSVLGMTVASIIYLKKPYMAEGKMTRLRAELVCEKSLAELSSFLNLGECMLLGRGEEKGGGRVRPSILADAAEAVLAAVYLDGGFDPVRKIVTTYLMPLTDHLQQENSDYKTELQELVQEKTGRTLSYHVIEESGPDHLKRFSVEVRLNSETVGSGEGKSKKEAEQLAAKAALASNDFSHKRHHRI